MASDTSGNVNTISILYQSLITRKFKKSILQKKQFPAFWLNLMDKSHSHKGVRRVANLQTICPRHIELGLANARVASG